MPFMRLLLPLLFALPVLAQVVVTAPKATLQPGEQLQFTATVSGRQVDDVVWTVEEPAGLTAPGGLFIAPYVDHRTLVRVRACLGPAIGEATVAVLPASAPERPQPPLPRELNQLVAGYLADDTGEPGLPFLNLETGQRFGPPCEVRVLPLPSLPSPMFGEGQVEGRFLTGYGTDFQVMNLDRVFPDTTGLLLSYREGGHVVRQERLSPGRHPAFEVPGKALLTSCQVEGLWKREERGRTWWESRIVPLHLAVRGLVPLAGNPMADAGHEAGWTVSARLRAPCGLAYWRGWPPSANLECLAVADPLDHTLRQITRDGNCADLAGLPERPGYQDGQGRKASFNGPTFVATWSLGQDARVGPLLVADSGNHVIRMVEAGGTVTTLAGSPQLPGHRDAADPREAQFNDPRGLAVDREGNIFVADHGNFVIRRIDHRTHAVTTFAGRPEHAGDTDHPALFRDLKGLCIGNHGKLFIADGATIRVIRNPRHPGTVETLFGRKDRRGCQGLVLGGSGTGLLDDPWGLAYDFRDKCLYIADRGNQCVWAGKEPAPGRGPELLPLLGDPGNPATAWGLLRDQAPGPLPEGFATLAGPRGVAVIPGADGPELVVAADRCVGLAGGLDHRFEPGQVDLHLHVPEQVQAGADLPVHYRLSSLVRFTAHQLRLRFLDAATGRPVADGVERRLPTGGSFPGVERTFTSPGEVDVDVLCTFSDGVTVAARQVVKVKP